MAADAHHDADAIDPAAEHAPREGELREGGALDAAPLDASSAVASPDDGDHEPNAFDARLEDSPINDGAQPIADPLDAPADHSWPDAAINDRNDPSPSDNEASLLDAANSDAANSDAPGLDAVGASANDGAAAADAARDANAVDDANAVGDASPDAATYVPSTGGYQVRAAALLDGQLAIAHALRSIDFYATARDAVAGGYFTFLDQQAHATSTNKSFGVQGRDAYAFARAFMLSGNEAYLDDGHFALDFLYAHGWDYARDGFYFLSDRQGNPLPRPADVPSDKWSYAQNYALVGITAMCEATRSVTDCAWMDRGIAALDTHYRDTSGGGYFDQASIDFRVRSGKGFNPTVDAITTHVLAAYLVSGRAQDRARLVSLADDTVNHLIASMNAPGVTFGFPEVYLSDWSIDTTNRTGFVGHLFKAAWALTRAYLVQPDVKYRDAARTVLRQMYDLGGFDRVNGAPNAMFDWTTGVISVNKEYWQLEQAVTAGLLHWSVSRTDADRAVFLEMADRSLDFFMTRLPDPQGGIFFLTSADGSTVLRRDKGDQWEGSYHNIELAYYTYLYGNLMLWRRPATLYYRFDPAPQERAVVLTPLATENDRLRITDVSRGGQRYPDFDGTTRTIRLPAATGGVFAVTFAQPP